MMKVKIVDVVHHLYATNELVNQMYDETEKMIDRDERTIVWNKMMEENRKGISFRQVISYTNWIKDRLKEHKL